MQFDQHTGEAKLTAREFEVTAMRDHFFRTSGSDDPVAAAEKALSYAKGSPSKQFIEWLSDGKLTKDDGDVVRVTEGAGTSGK